MSENVLFAAAAAPGLVGGFLAATWLPLHGWRLPVLLVGGIVPIVVVAWFLAAVFDITGWSAALLIVEAFANWGTWVVGALLGAALRTRGGADYADGS